MACIAPLNIPDPSFENNKIRIEVPCGKCSGCLITRRNEWTDRLKIELQDASSAHFITLTYDEENVTYGEYHPTLVKSDLQKFLKRLRRNVQNKLRYYAVGEYGTDTLRPHYHIILFNLPNDLLGEIDKAWKMGYSYIGTVTPASIHYVTKYHVNKTFSPEGCEPSFATMSRRPGIGHSYVEKYTSYHDGKINRNYIPQQGGIKTRLPRYYKDRLYTPAERELIARESSRLFNERSSPLAIQEHNRLNPDKNFFQYQEELKQYQEDNFRVKINQLNKL